MQYYRQTNSKDNYSNANGTIRSRKNNTSNNNNKSTNSMRIPCRLVELMCQTNKPSAFDISIVLGGKLRPTNATTTTTVTKKKNLKYNNEKRSCLSCS